jgi:hypothetical protein
MASPPIDIEVVSKICFAFAMDDYMSDDEYSTPDEDESSDCDSFSVTSIQVSPRIELPKQVVYILDSPYEMPVGHQLFFQRLNNTSVGGSCSNIASVLVVRGNAPTSIRTIFPFFTDYCFGSDAERHVFFSIARHRGPLVVIGNFDIYRLFALRGATNSPRCTSVTIAKFESTLQDAERRLVEMYALDKQGYDPFMSDADFEVLHSKEEDKPIKLFFDSLFNPSGYNKRCPF